MTYVEWLRVRGTLKWTAIVLGILFVIACVARVTLPAHSHMERSHEMNFGSFVVFGAVVALIVATMLGAPFARENDGHLEVALTKPIDRIGLALMTIGVDAAGIIGALAVGTLFGIALHTIFFPPWISFHSIDLIVTVFGIVGPLSWYAMLAAATSSLRRGYGAILGIAWPVAAIVAGLSLVDPNDNALAALIHTVFWTLSRIDPLVYMHFNSQDMSMTADPTWLPRLAMLAILAAGYGALAVAQWRRVEA
ncbi:MAG TPA: hypothetical protein VNU22_03710 [Candidatus Acidoferrum sp.]|jgi:hypothetical protein|nr:hypothetical protein [Candidatus Acidoferrum sp.]